MADRHRFVKRPWSRLPGTTPSSVSRTHPGPPASVVRGVGSFRHPGSPIQRIAESPGITLVGDRRWQLLRLAAEREMRLKFVLGNSIS